MVSITVPATNETLTTPIPIKPTSAESNRSIRNQPSERLKNTSFAWPSNCSQQSVNLCNLLKREGCED
jgi:invasion protein IalB